MRVIDRDGRGEQGEGGEHRGAPAEQLRRREPREHRRRRAHRRTHQPGQEREPAERLERMREAVGIGRADGPDLPAKLEPRHVRRLHEREQQEVEGRILAGPLLAVNQVPGEGERAER